MSSSLIVRSHLPGRIRFDAPLLRRLPAIAAALETDLSRCSEIILVRANGLTGSILVTFSPELGLTYVENTVRAVLLQQVEQVASVELVEAQESNRAKKSSLLRLLASTEPHRKLRRRACIIESVSMAQWLEATVGPCTCSVAYSMGLFSALAHAGALSFPSALEIARDVCTAAHESAQAHTWAIGAAVDFPLARTRELMQEASPDLEVTDLYGANTVLFTGHRDPVIQVLDRALAEGASSTRLIPVTAPFHTTGLQVIEPVIAAALDRLHLQKPTWPILSSITQEMLVTESDVRNEICRNVSRPMNWFATLKAALSLQQDGMVESGASFTLTELARDLFPDTCTYRDFRDLQAADV